MKILFINKKKLKINKTILGLILIKLSFIFFLSFISFLIKNINGNFQNLLGKIGDIISIYFLYNGIGISIFLLPILLFFLGLKIFFYEYIKIRKILLHSLFFIFWMPITLSFIFAKQILSGLLIFKIKYLLIYFIGKIGLLLIIITTIIIYIILVFQITDDNIFFKKLKKKYLIIF